MAPTGHLANAGSAVVWCPSRPAICQARLRKRSPLGLRWLVGEYQGLIPTLKLGPFMASRDCLRDWAFGGSDLLLVCSSLHPWI